MDNSVLITNLINKGQGKRVVFLKHARRDAVGKSVCALINSEGGDILLGVSEKGELHSITDVTTKEKELSLYLNQHIQPNAPISVAAVRYRQKDLVWISVWEGAQKPYAFEGTIFTRTVTGDTHKADNRSISELIHQRRAAEFHWERQSMLGVELSDLDLDQVQKTIQYFELRNPDQSFGDDAEGFLSYLGLLQNGHFTNAAIILFGKQPHRYLPQASVRLTVYQGEKDTHTFLYDRLYEGSLFQNIDQIFDYINVLFGTKSNIKGKQRSDKANYPVIAIREGIMNAIAHRDYSSVSSTIHIAIYPKRTMISSYGKLPDGIKLSDLKKDHASILRNPDIARVCFIRGLIEMLGSGTQRMIKDCKQHSFEVPIWREGAREVVVEFPGLGVGEGVDEGVSEGVTVKDIDGVSEGVKGELENILQYIKLQPGINAREIVSLSDKSLSSIERYLKILREQGFIEFRGAPKSGGYHLA